ncbi:MAG: hypothetical protein ACE5IL_06250 [Myxococcota bacterium]
MIAAGGEDAVGRESESGDTPAELRSAVRSGVLEALAGDFDLRGGRTARRLVTAGVTGSLGALGITMVLSNHPFGHHPPWHLAVFSTLWAGLLIVSLALVLLRVRTPALALWRAAAVGLLGLGLAGLCSTLCPDQHFLGWWTGTPAGAWTERTLGLSASALCFGITTSGFLAAVAAALLLRGRMRGPWSRALPAAALFLMLEPAVVLQSFDTSIAVLLGWTFGTGAGAYIGVLGATILLERAPEG